MSRLRLAKLAVGAASMADLGIPDFETESDCKRRQRKMRRRFGQHEDLRHLGKKFATCESDWCRHSACFDACHFGARNRRLKEIASGYELFTARGGPLVDVSLVHPSWRQELGELQSFNIPAARQWLCRQLKELIGLVAIGSFEASVNTELDGRQHWAIGVHAIAAGATKPALRQALNLPPAVTLPKGARPVVLSAVNNLGRQLGYALKHFVEERRAYTNQINGRTQRRHLPPPSELWAEHDAWLASLPSGSRTIAIGCQRRSGKFCPINDDELRLEKSES